MKIKNSRGNDSEEEMIQKEKIKIKTKIEEKIKERMKMETKMDKKMKTKEEIIRKEK